MKSKQVLSIDQMKHLRELGLDTSDASMYWLKDREGNRFLVANDEYCYEMPLLSPVPTYTLQDILDKLPSYVTYDNEEYQLQIIPPCVCYRYVDYGFADLVYKNNVDILENAYKMLCWCIENGYIRKEE